MLNHDTGQMDWQDSSSSSTNNGYINPNNLYDQMTHVGREALSDAHRHPDAEHDDDSDNRHAKIFFILIVALMLIAFFVIPGRS